MAERKRYIPVLMQARIKLKDGTVLILSNISEVEFSGYFIRFTHGKGKYSEEEFINIKDVKGYIID